MLMIDPVSRTHNIQPQGKTILLVGRPGHLRDALMGLLSTLPGLAAIQATENGQLALGAAGKHCPDLLIAGGLPEVETNELLQLFKQNWPGTPTLVLTENARQIRRVEQAGATRVLPARTPSRQLLSEICVLFKR